MSSVAKGGALCLRHMAVPVCGKAADAVLLGRVPRPPPGQAMAEEPVKPKIRSRKPKPAAASLFEWAFALEQEREREAEPVGAGP